MVSRKLKTSSRYRAHLYSTTKLSLPHRVNRSTKLFWPSGKVEIFRPRHPKSTLWGWLTIGTRKRR